MRKVLPYTPLIVVALALFVLSRRSLWVALANKRHGYGWTVASLEGVPLRELIGYTLVPHPSKLPEVWQACPNA